MALVDTHQRLLTVVAWLQIPKLLATLPLPLTLNTCTHARLTLARTLTLPLTLTLAYASRLAHMQARMQSRAIVLLLT